MAVLCGLLAIAASRGIERQRAVWTLVPLAAFFCFFIVGLIATRRRRTPATIAVGLVSTLVLLTAPVALTYAALSRRLIDVGFFLNRAAVFTIVSAIVIGAFVLAEWAANAWLTSATHITSAFVGMVVALGLGISLRYIHKHVERFVDRVFFRKRHEDESALRRFAQEASYISDRSTLLDRAVQTVKDHTSADEAAILVRDGTRTYDFATDGQAGGGQRKRSWHRRASRVEQADRSAPFPSFAVTRRACVPHDLTRRPCRRAGLWAQARRRGICSRRIGGIAGSRAWRGDGARHPVEPRRSRLWSRYERRKR